jgi:TolB-like protein
MAEDEFAVLGDVIAEELIRALSHAPELNLISRLSTAAFRGRTIVLPEIAAHLSADYVLSGSYASDGRQTKIDAELVEAKSGKLLFARRLEGDASAILRSDQDLLGPLAAEICNTVIARELQRSKLQPLATLKAYTLLIGAIALMHRLSPRDFEEARQLLQALIDRGNRHPIPLAWLATWHVLRVQQGWSDDRQRDAYMALECTKRALDMDSECSLALAADGFTHVNLLKRLDIGRERYDLAIAANSSHAFAWLLKGTLHAFMGEGERAVEDTQRALRLTPLDPHRFMYDSLAASACIAAHQYDNALELARRSLRANRKHTSTLRVLAVAQWRLGQHEEAVATGNELLKLEPNLTVGRWLAGAPSAAYPVGQEFARTLREVGIPD